MESSALFRRAVCFVCVATAFASATPVGLLNTSYVLSTSRSGASPLTVGINSGHNHDASWTSWLQHLGVTSLRIFGLAGDLTTLQQFSATAFAWGSDLSGTPVTSVSSFHAAVAQLRSPEGRTPPSNAYENPPKWAAFEAMMATGTTAPDGGSMEATVAAAQAVGVDPLLVFWMPCAVFNFTTLDPTKYVYWGERFELYRHMYVAARWAYVRGVRKLEFWNEGDLNAPCITAWSWLEHYTLQSQAIQNAFADLNSDVASGELPCPASSCPLQPVILASAFAQASFNGTSSASTAAYGVNGAALKYGISNDYYAYMGMETVQNEHSSFPLIQLEGDVASLNGSATSSSLQNLDEFSIHSYGKTGIGLGQLCNGDVASIAWARGARGASAGAMLAQIPVAVTEHAAHTTAAWNSLGSTQDNDYEASRLGAQILFMAIANTGYAPSLYADMVLPEVPANGFESYIFKFSSLEQSSAITTGCTRFLSPPGVAQIAGTTGVSGSSTCGPGGKSLCVPCGVQKTGVMWGENLAYPYPIGDSSLSAEGARMLFSSLAGNKTMETVTGAALPGSKNMPGMMNNPWVASSTLSAPATMSLPIAVVNDGMRRTLLWVNEGYNPMDIAPGAGDCPASGGASVPCYPAYASVQNIITLNISAWGVPTTASIVHNIVAAGSMGEVAGIATAGTTPQTANSAGAPGCTGADGCAPATNPSSDVRIGNSVSFTSENGVYQTLTVVAPAYSVNQLIAPSVSQTEVLLEASGDAQISAGANVGTNYGSAPTMEVSTSPTATHDGTSMALVRFDVPSPGYVLTALLEITLATSPDADMPLLVIGTAGNWTETSITWADASFLTNGTVPNAPIASPAGNFASVEAPNSVAAHLTVVASLSKSADVHRVEVSTYVRSCGGTASFALVRRMRHGAFFGNSGGAVAADSLSGGATVSFYTKETAAYAPKLRVMSSTGGVSPPPQQPISTPPPSPAPKQEPNPPPPPVPAPKQEPNPPPPNPTPKQPPVPSTPPPPNPPSPPVPTLPSPPSPVPKHEPNPLPPPLVPMLPPQQPNPPPPNPAPNQLPAPMLPPPPSPEPPSPAPPSPAPEQQPNPPPPNPAPKEPPVPMPLPPPPSPAPPSPASPSPAPKQQPNPPSPPVQQPNPPSQPVPILPPPPVPVPKQQPNPPPPPVQQPSPPPPLVPILPQQPNPPMPAVACTALCIVGHSHCMVNGACSCCPDANPPPSLVCNMMCVNGWTHCTVNGTCGCCPYVSGGSSPQPPPSPRSPVVCTMSCINGDINCITNGGCTCCAQQRKFIASSKAVLNGYTPKTFGPTQQAEFSVAMTASLGGEAACACSVTVTGVSAGNRRRLQSGSSVTVSFSVSSSRPNVQALVDSIGGPGFATAARSAGLTALTSVSFVHPTPSPASNNRKTIKVHYAVIAACSAYAALALLFMATASVYLFRTRDRGCVDMTKCESATRVGMTAELVL